MKRFFFATALILLFPPPAPGHETTVGRADVGIEEKLGSAVDPDAVFLDEEGATVRLGKTIDKPTIIAPVYLSCTHACPLLLNGLADVLGKMDLVRPGRDYQAMTVSFDELDTPALARDRKRNYLKAVGRPFPAKDWIFLTGSAASIKKFTESIGFKFQRDGAREFSHPVVLVVVAPGGKIVRYLEGVRFLPFELTMALTEASAGRVGSPSRKALMYCFSYDPLKKSYVFNVLKVVGTVMIVFIGSFLAYLLLSSRGKDKTTGN